ncbi:MAG: hypothetical protein ACRCVH_12335 [Vagococcus fluvialis]
MNRMDLLAYVDKEIEWANYRCRYYREDLIDDCFDASTESSAKIEKFIIEVTKKDKKGKMIGRDDWFLIEEAIERISEYKGLLSLLLEVFYEIEKIDARKNK